MDKNEILAECQRLEKEINDLYKQLNDLNNKLQYDEEFSYHYDDEQQLWCFEYAKEHLKLEYAEVGCYLIRVELQISGITVNVDKKLQWNIDELVPSERIPLLKWRIDKVENFLEEVEGKKIFRR